MNLLTLYFSILVPILSEWINDEDLCCLDTAVCSKKLRKDLLRLLVQCSIMNTDISQFSNYFKAWIMLRRLSLRKYAIDKTVSPEDLIRLFKGKQLRHLESTDSEKLAILLKQTSATADVVLLKCNSRSVQMITVIGYRITALRLEDEESWFVKLVTRACPNLTSIGLNESEISPFLFQHCPQLQSIYCCKLVDSQIICDLSKTSEMDESAVCIEEGKYFNMTGIGVLTDVSEKDCKMLAPVMKHLNHISCHNVTVLKIAAERCFKLHSIGSSCRSEVAILCTVIRNSSSLVTSLSLCGPLIDLVIDTITGHCPLLESLRLIDSTLSREVFSELFDKTSLTSFCSYSSQGVLKLHVNPRHMRSSLYVTGSVPRDVVDFFLKHCNGFREVDTTAYKFMDEELSRMISIRRK